LSRRERTRDARGVAEGALDGRGEGRRASVELHARDAVVVDVEQLGAAAVRAHCCPHPSPQAGRLPSRVLRRTLERDQSQGISRAKPKGSSRTRFSAGMLKRAFHFAGPCK
jgi:hypothetical protein